MRSKMTEISGEEWLRKSQRGEVCNVVGCRNKPTHQCGTCKSHICSDHVEAHVHVITDEEIEDRKDMGRRPAMK